jgi:hypothetical protein
MPFKEKIEDSGRGRLSQKFFEEATKNLFIF